MNVLSLFDGMSCGRIALERAGVPVTSYYAAEIDKYAIQVSKANWPDIVHVGDVTKITACMVPHTHLLIAGSPCQGFSNAGDGLNFDDPRSKLFFEFVRLLKEIRKYNPKVYFFFENVKMKTTWRDIISDILNVQPVLIDSALVSAQKRRRYYWTNIPFLGQPRDKHIYVKDILLQGESVLRWQNSKDGAVKDIKTGTLRAGKATDGLWKFPKIILDEFDEHIVIKEATKAGTAKVYPGDIFDSGFPNSKTRRGRVMTDKTNCITATKIDWKLFIEKGKYRNILPIECERLQGVPDGYTNSVSDIQAFKMLGNGWQVDTIEHLFSPLGYYKFLF